MKLFAICTGFLMLSVAQAQDLPDGKGKDLVQKICADCHGVDVIVSQRATKEGWQSIVDSMVERGASGTKEEIATIVDYLAKNFPQEPSKLKANSGSSVAAKRGVR